MDWDNLLNQMKSGTIRLSSDLTSDHEYYTNLRDKLACRVAQSSGLFVLGTNLFERLGTGRENDDDEQERDGSHCSRRGRRRPVVVSSVAEEFESLRETLNDLARFLTETCMLIECARQRLDKLRSLEARINDLLNEIEQVERASTPAINTTGDENNDQDDLVRSNKARLEQIVELKKVLRAIIDEKDMLTASGLSDAEATSSSDSLAAIVGDSRDSSGQEQQKQHHQHLKAEFDSRLRSITNATMSDLNTRLDGLIKYAKERFAYLEVAFFKFVFSNQN